MAFSVAQTIQFDDLTGSTSWTKSSISTTVGNLLIIAVGVRSSSAASVTDSAGNTWSVAATATNSNTATILYAQNAAAITSYTINGNGLSRMMSQFYEVSGAGSVLVDASSTSTGSSSSITSGASGTPSGAADIAIGIAIQGNDSTFSAGTFTSGAGTEVLHNSAQTACVTGETGSLILSSATAQTYTASSNISQAWVGAVCLWKPAPAKGGTMGLMGVG
ncbi:MAG TPA: hypothetical protein VJC09_01555 [Candidatus Saccharimonadales bacterium]|nr:hypothetical protein [Candidatus Saccharimonadales bacterium]